MCRYWGSIVCWYLGRDGVLVLGEGWCVGTKGWIVCWYLRRDGVLVLGE